MLNKREKDVLYLVIQSQDEGIYPEDIAKELNMSLDEVEKILDKLEERGFLYSQEEDD